MQIVIDCEFNSFQGELISMALVTMGDPQYRDFYEVLECQQPIDGWVLTNVIPVLNKSQISRELFQEKLANFLRQFDSIELIADWPDDIKYFCESLITGPGKMMRIPPLTISLVKVDYNSLVPHNALEDARAISRALRAV